MSTTIIGKLILVARLQAGMTRADLAKTLAVPWQTVWAWERGRQQPLARNLRRALAACNRKRNKGDDDGF